MARTVSGVLQSDIRIDLLVTDVGLPGGLNGRQMADAARVIRPDLKVLFITGFAENALLNNGQLAPRMSVLTKPFALETLAAPHSRTDCLTISPHHAADKQCGRASIFAIACVVVIVWAVTGPFFHYSDTWQLVINTGTDDRPRS